MTKSLLARVAGLLLTGVTALCCVHCHPVGDDASALVYRGAAAPAVDPSAKIMTVTSHSALLFNENGKAYCGAAIIANTAVATDAHCLPPDKYTLENLMVGFGTNAADIWNNRETNKLMVAPKRLIVHSSYVDLQAANGDFPNLERKLDRMTADQLMTNAIEALVQDPGEASNDFLRRKIRRFATSAVPESFDIAVVILAKSVPKGFGPVPLADTTLSLTQGAGFTAVGAGRRVPAAFGPADPAANEPAPSPTFGILETAQMEFQGNRPETEPNPGDDPAIAPASMAFVGSSVGLKSELCTGDSGSGAFLERGGAVSLIGLVRQVYGKERRCAPFAEFADVRRYNLWLRCAAAQMKLAAQREGVDCKAVAGDMFAYPAF